MSKGANNSHEAISWQMSEASNPEEKGIIGFNEANLPFYCVAISNQTHGLFKFFVMRNTETGKCAETIIWEMPDGNKRLYEAGKVCDGDGEKMVEDIWTLIETMKEQFQLEEPKVTDFRQCKNLDEVMAVFQAGRIQEN